MPTERSKAMLAISDDEPVFILRGRDALAAWNRRAVAPADAAHFAQALYDLYHARGYTDTLEQCRIDADWLLRRLAEGEPA
jgi:hypothetical protein